MTNVKQRILKNLETETYVRLMPSKIHGIGVVAIKPIPPNTDPFRLPYRRLDKTVKMSKQDVKNVPPTVKKLLEDFVGHSRGKDMYYDVPTYGMNGIDVSFYLNHSDQPNMKMINDPDSDFVGLITERMIHPGEELTIDYDEYQNWE